VFKALPPVLITLAVATFCIVVDPMHILDRIVIATTALLAEIFLQLGFDAKLPNSGEVCLFALTNSNPISKN
jgi:hypothetical protein